MADAIGPTLSKYRILEKLSTGGMGVVYLAEDTTLHRKVALKVLTQDWSSESDRLARFRFEAQALATLNHPNIVTIYSVEEEGGVHFLTMELVEGKTLAELIPSVGFQVERLFDLAIPLADALAAAHARGIIHRDLKPGNVMVNREGRVKILDFGLAKQRDDGGEPLAGPAREPITRDGQLMGTVPYMSPEQIQGEPADHRSDIFALGIILFEMATGSRPFDGKSWTDLASAILRDTPPSVTTLNIYLPRHLGRIIRHCLEKNPQRRFQTALDLRNELEELQKEVLSGVFAVPNTLPETSSAAIQRPPPPPRPRDNEKLLAILATVLVLAVLATVVWLRTTRPGERRSDAPIVRPVAEEGKRIVVLPLENLGPPDHEYFAAGITEEITTRLSSVSALHVISRTTARNYERTAKTAQEIGAELGVDYLLEGSVRWSSGGDEASQVRVTPQLIRVADDTHVWSQSYDRVLTDIFTVQSEIAEEVIHQLGIALREPEQTALAARPTQHLEAYQAYLRGMDYAGRREPSEENLLQAAQMFGRATELDPGFALAWAELSEVHSQLYHFTTDRTEERLARARAAADRALALAPELPASHRALGYYHYWGHGDYDAALREFDLAAQSLPNDSQLLEGIAYIRRRQGRFTEAIAGLRQALELDPQSSRLASELAQTYMTTRQYELAARYYDAAIALSPNEAAPYQLKALNLLLWRSGVAEARATLAVMPRPEELPATMAWLRQELVEGRYEAALARIEAAPVQLIGTDAGVFPRTLLRGQVFELLDRRAEARQSFLAARVVMERLAKLRPDDPRVHGALALAYAGLDRKEDAVREGRLAVAQAPVSEDAIKGPAFLEQLAAVYAAVGEQEQAIDLLEKLLTMPSNLSVAMLRIDPQWRPLEDHPRFLRLVASSTGAAG